MGVKPCTQAKSGESDEGFICAGLRGHAVF